MATTNINIRTDLEVKAEAQKIFAMIGLDMSTAINLFLRQVILSKAIPFTLTAKEPQKQRHLTYGCWKDDAWIAEDFDAPLDDFKEYM